jgi:hypothetical protein
VYALKYGILAPYSRPWDNDDVEGSGMNLVIRESCEALAKQGHTKSFYTSVKEYKQSYFITKNIEVIFVENSKKIRS